MTDVDDTAERPVFLTACVDALLIEETEERCVRLLTARFGTIPSLRWESHRGENALVQLAFLEQLEPRLVSITRPVRSALTELDAILLTAWGRSPS